MTPLSDLHAMLGQIERQTDAARLNEIVNHESVLPWVRGASEGPLDLSEIVAHPANVLLMGEHGGILFAHQQPGLFEAHTQVLPEGRGAWAVSMARAALHFMFTRTDCVEVLMRCPEGNRGALALIKRVGGQFDLTVPNGWIIDGKPVSTDLYTLRIQDWIKQAPGLAERGSWFFDRLSEEYGRNGKPAISAASQDWHRPVGAAVEMILGGQPDKGAVFYNRFAAMVGGWPIQIAGYDPLTIDTGDALLVVRKDSFWMLDCRLEAA